MGVDRSFIEENSAQRARLRALVGRWGDDVLARPLPAGWTVAGVLGHLAFWDQRIGALVETWRRAGPSAVPRPLEHADDVDWINDATKPLLLALPPRRAAELAVSIAETVDRVLETLPDEFVAHNAAAGHPVNFLRAQHRREHLDEIEQALDS